MATLPYSFDCHIPAHVPEFMGVKFLLAHRHFCSPQLRAMLYNAVKFLIACGVISFIAPVFVGSITDVQLTMQLLWFPCTLKDKPGIFRMADRGFTMKDMPQEFNTYLNLWKEEQNFL